MHKQMNLTHMLHKFEFESVMNHLFLSERPQFWNISSGYASFHHQPKSCVQTNKGKLGPRTNTAYHILAQALHRGHK